MQCVTMSWDDFSSMGPTVHEVLALVRGDIEWDQRTLSSLYADRGNLNGRHTHLVVSRGHYLPWMPKYLGCR